MTINIMFGLGREAPVEYTIKHFKEFTFELFNKLTAEVSTNNIDIKLSSNKFVIANNSATLKTSNKLNVKLNIKPDENN